MNLSVETKRGLAMIFFIILSFTIPLSGCSKEISREPIDEHVEKEDIENEALKEDLDSEEDMEDEAEESSKNNEDINNDEKKQDTKEKDKKSTENSTEVDIIEILKEIYAPLDYFYSNLDNNPNTPDGVGLPKKYNTREKLLAFFQTTMSYDVAVAWIDYWVLYDVIQDEYYIPAMGRPATIHDYVPQITVIEKTDTRIVVEEFYDNDWEPYKTITHIAIKPNKTYQWIMDYE